MLLGINNPKWHTSTVHSTLSIKRRLLDKFKSFLAKRPPFGLNYTIYSAVRTTFKIVSIRNTIIISWLILPKIVPILIIFKILSPKSNPTSQVAPSFVTLLTLFRETNPLNLLWRFSNLKEYFKISKVMTILHEQ